MPTFSIGFPCQVVTSRVLSSFSSVLSAAIKEDAEIIIGVQDVANSDPRVIEFLSEQPITQLISTNNCSSLSCNLNHIISKCKGRYFIRTDDDDFMHPSRISNLNQIIRGGIDFAILGQGYKCFEGKRLSSMVIPASNSIDNKIKLLLGVPFCHPAITIDLSKVGKSPYDINQKYAQDYMLYITKIKSGKFLGVNHIGTYYRSPSSTTYLQMEKRRRQLEDHERAMKILWNQIFPRKITDEEIHSLRSTLVTSEFSNIRSDNRAWCINMLEEGIKHLIQHVREP